MKRHLIFAIMAVLSLAFVCQAHAAVVSGSADASFTSYSPTTQNNTGWWGPQYYASISNDGTVFTTGIADCGSSSTTLTWANSNFSSDVTVGSSSTVAIATLTYFNGETVADTSATDVTSSIQVNITYPVTTSGTFTSKLTFTLTVNTCDPTASADSLALAIDLSDPIEFVADGVAYTISLAGFDLTTISYTTEEEVTEYVTRRYYDRRTHSWVEYQVPYETWVTVTKTINEADGVYDSSITLGENMTATITLYATITATPIDVGDDNGGGQVPEPATCLIWSFFGGIGAIGYWRRKRAA